VRVRHIELQTRQATARLTLWVEGPISPNAWAPLAIQLEKVMYELALEDRRNA
jgi:hypothetical protein